MLVFGEMGDWSSRIKGRLIGRRNKAVEINFEHGVAGFVELVGVGGVVRIHAMGGFPIVWNAIAVGILGGWAAVNCAESAGVGFFVDDFALGAEGFYFVDQTV